MFTLILILLWNQLRTHLLLFVTLKAVIGNIFVIVGRNMSSQRGRIIVQRHFAAVLVIYVWPGWLLQPAPVLHEALGKTISYIVMS